MWGGYNGCAPNPHTPAGAASTGLLLLLPNRFLLSLLPFSSSRLFFSPLRSHLRPSTKAAGARARSSGRAGGPGRVPPAQGTCGDLPVATGCHSMETHRGGLSPREPVTTSVGKVSRVVAMGKLRHGAMVGCWPLGGGGLCPLTAEWLEGLSPGWGALSVPQRGGRCHGEPGVSLGVGMQWRTRTVWGAAGAAPLRPPWDVSPTVGVPRFAGNTLSQTPADPGVFSGAAPSFSHWGPQTGAGDDH